VKIRRLPVQDEYADGDRMAVMADDRIAVLSPMASHALAQIGPEGVELDELAQLLVDRFGAPPGQDPLALTRGVVRQLEETGLVKQLR
jgi:hypothetical protein